MSIIDIFNKQYIGIASRLSEWESEIDVCSDAMYLRLTGKSPEEIFPALRSVHADA